MTTKRRRWSITRRRWLVILVFSIISCVLSTALLVISYNQFLSEQENRYDYKDSKAFLKIRYGAALCAVALDEERYIDEWVDYNLAIGFHRIYIYDNSWNHTLREWYMLRNDTRIQVIHFPRKTPQYPAYNHCASKAIADGMTWSAFFDIDEFLVIKNHTYVAPFLEEFCVNGSLAISLRTFGSSNHSMYKPFPVLQRFQYYYRAPNTYVKSIARLRDFSFVDHPHYPILKEGYWNHDTNGKHVDGPINVNQSATDVAVLHHYRTKSQEEYIRKSLKGRADIDCDKYRSVCKRQLEEAKTDFQKLTGYIFDDSAWNILTERVPKYRVFV